MIERVLPAVTLPAPARPHPRTAIPAGPVAVPRTARPQVKRNEAILNAPARAGMLIGASAALYAVTLTGVSLLQANDDATLAAARNPYLAAVASARAANDSLESAISTSDAQVRALTSDYGLVGQDISGYQARLDSLAALVSKIQGSVAALPTRINLPSVTTHGSVGGRAPSTSATTKASGAP